MSATPKGFRPARSQAAEAQKRRTAADSLREITESAMRILAEHPFRELSIPRIMAGTALSRPAFYQHFRDLHHLMERLLADMDTAFRESADPWIRGEGEVLPALRESLRGVVRACVEHGPVLRAIAEAAPQDEELERAWLSFLADWDSDVAARIVEQQQAGVVAPCDPIQMAHALNRLDLTVLIEKFGRRPHADPEEVLGILSRIWIGALYADTTSAGTAQTTAFLNERRTK